MEVLFVAYDPDHGIGLELLVFEHGGPDILSDIDACPVGAQNYFCPQFPQIRNNGSILPFLEDPFFQTLCYGRFPQKIGIAFQIDLFEVDPLPLVGGIEAVKDPGIHLLPEGNDFLIACFPFPEHLLSCTASFRFQEEFIIFLIGIFRVFGSQFCDLILQKVIEFDVEIPHKVVPFDPGGFGGGSIAQSLIGKHGFADVDPPVIDQIDRHNIVSHPCQKGADTGSQGIVSHMSQMLGLIGIGGGKLHKDLFSFLFRQKGGGENGRRLCDRIPEEGMGFELHIDKGFHFFRFFHIAVGGKDLCNFCCDCIRGAFEGSGKAEAVDGYIPFHAFRALFGGDDKIFFQDGSGEIFPKCPGEVGNAR